MHITRRRLAVSVLFIVPALIGLTGCTRFGATLSRPVDPVVLAGSAVPKLLGGAPAHVVGFAWDGSAWRGRPTWTRPGTGRCSITRSAGPR